MTRPVLHLVHCIDTEGPLDEDLSATFQRIKDLFGLDYPPSEETLAALQGKTIPLNGLEDEVAKVLHPQILSYNRNWDMVNVMLDDAMSPTFRQTMLDDSGGGWVYSWHCVDHVGYSENPRHKDLGYGRIFHAYRRKLVETGSTRDEINWHFHPLSLTRKPLAAATSFANSMDQLLYLMARRILDDRWFPTTNRPGFHSERPDGNAFLENWIPFDYANQACADVGGAQQDTRFGRFGDWRRASRDWLGYHPHHDDYQRVGNCRRWIFRCLNVGTRLRQLTLQDVRSAFEDSRRHGSAILAFADHDYRDIRPDVEQVRDMLRRVRVDYPDVCLLFSGAEAAARAHVAVMEPKRLAPPPEFSLWMDDSRLHVRLEQGALFGPQPFLAIKDIDQRYHHDNLDVIALGRHWTYVLDDQTLPLSEVMQLGVGGAGPAGGYGVAVLDLMTPR